MSKTSAAHMIPELAALVFIATTSLAMARTEPAAPVEPSIPYTVKPQDKLIRLSADLLNRPADWPDVARFNRLKNPNAIKPGQTIRIPLRLMKAQPASGKVVSVFGEVQLSGSKAEVGVAVPEGSKLQTGANSSALIELADGSRMTLLPNTLAELVTSRGYATRDAGTSGSSTWFSGLVRLVPGAVDTVAAKGVRRAGPGRCRSKPRPRSSVFAARSFVLPMTTRPPKTPAPRCSKALSGPTTPRSAVPPNWPWVRARWSARRSRTSRW